MAPISALCGAPHKADYAKRVIMRSRSRDVVIFLCFEAEALRIISVAREAPRSSVSYPEAFVFFALGFGLGLRLAAIFMENASSIGLSPSSSVSAAASRARTQRVSRCSISGQDLSCRFTARENTVTSQSIKQPSSSIFLS